MFQTIEIDLSNVIIIRIVHFEYAVGIVETISGACGIFFLHDPFGICASTELLA